MLFWEYLLFRSIFHYKPYRNHKNLPPPLNLYQPGQVRCFWNRTSIGNILEGCRILGFDKGVYKNRPVEQGTSVVVIISTIWLWTLFGSPLKDLWLFVCLYSVHQEFKTLHLNLLTSYT